MTEPAAAARSRLYQLLAAGFGFPERGLFETIASGSYVEALEEALSALAFDVEPSGLLAALRLPPETTYESFQADFIQHFELGAAGPPCPLYGGVYMGGRTTVWEELIRFYNHFGLHLSKENRDLPDHLATELEFVHFLTYREAETTIEASVTALRRAERDFLTRHPVVWLGQLVTRLEKKGAPAFYRALVDLTRRFTTTDLRYLESLVGRETGQSALVRLP